MAHTLREIDGLEIAAVVDNETDPISPSPSLAVQHLGLFAGVPLTSIDTPDDPRGSEMKELRMDSMCCGAHGLSLSITAREGETKHTLLFDVGPEEDVWERNATRMRLDLAAIEHIHLSHWHRDHSGGMLRALSMINEAKTLAPRLDSASYKKVVVDLHPDRPDFRGIKTRAGKQISLDEDPRFEDIERAGGELRRENTVHKILGDMFMVSGEIPRLTAYEDGAKGGIRFRKKTGEWENDEAIADERFIMCNLKGKGLVVFSGCSHAGIVNVCRYALKLVNGSVPLYAVVGGFHLADNNQEKMQSSIQDLKVLQPKIFIPGHCTGWKFKFMIEREMPGTMVPSFVGTTYTL